MSYYEPHTDPAHGARLSVIWERPATSAPSASGFMIHRPGPRTRLVIEGEADLLKLIGDTLAPTLHQLRDAINGAASTDTPA